jgi:hypothetical protein
MKEWPTICGLKHLKLLNKNASHIYEAAREHGFEDIKPMWATNYPRLEVIQPVC